MPKLKTVVFGLIILFSSPVLVFGQSQPTTCFFSIIDPQNPQNNYNGQKQCYSGCCSTSTTDPCCPTYLDDNSLSGGAIGGIIIGVLVFFVLIAGGIFLYIRRSKLRDKDSNLYPTQQKPSVAYIGNSEKMSDTTDYKRENLGYATSISTQARSRDTSLSNFPPLAHQEDDSDIETASNKISHKSAPFSVKSEPQNFRQRNYADSVSSVETKSDKYSVVSDPMPESRARRPRDIPIRDESPGAKRRRDPSNRERDHSSYQKNRSDHGHESPRGHPPSDRSPRGRHPSDHSPHGSLPSERRPKTSTSSFDSRDNGPRRGHHGHHQRPHHRPNTHSTSSVAFREHNKSISESMTSDAGSIGTTV